MILWPRSFWPKLLIISLNTNYQMFLKGNILINWLKASVRSCPCYDSVHVIVLSLFSSWLFTSHLLSDPLSLLVWFRPPRWLSVSALITFTFVPVVFECFLVFDFSQLFLWPRLCLIPAWFVCPCWMTTCVPTSSPLPSPCLMCLPPLTDYSCTEPVSK